MVGINSPEGTLMPNVIIVSPVYKTIVKTNFPMEDLISLVNVPTIISLRTFKKDLGIKCLPHRLVVKSNSQLDCNDTGLPPRDHIYRF